MRCDINDFGAVADGRTDNTEAIQKAIDHCANAGGGTVEISGGIYLSYTIFLKSHVELRIEAGATLLGGPDPLKYPEVKTNEYWIPERCSRLNRRCLIYALHCDVIAITGRGTIDGHAQNFTRCKEEPMELHCVWERVSDVDIPGRTLLIVDCTNVLLTDFLIRDSAGWSMWILKCARVQIQRLRIDCDMRLPNVDGIHISSSREITVSDCIIRSSDDALVLRSHQEQLYKPTPCEQVSVSNCVLTSGSAAVRIGWTHDYLIRDCSFSDLVIHHSFSGIGILIPALGTVQYDPPRGPGAPVPPESVEPFGVYNLQFRNIAMECEASPFVIRLDENAACSGVRNITLSGVTAECSGYPFIMATAEQNVSDIRFHECVFRLKPAARTLEPYWSFQPSMRLDYARNIQFDQVSFPTAVCHQDARLAPHS